MKRRNLNSVKMRSKNVRSIRKVSKSFKKDKLFFNPLEDNVHQTEKKNLLVDSWPIFPQNLSLLCLGNLGLIAQFRGFLCAQVFLVV